MNYNINKYQRAAIIGYWRMGAKVDQIAEIMDLFYMQVFAIINEYQAS